jgi:hypothetical protein
MRNNLLAFEITAAVLLPGFMAMPSFAADPTIPDNSSSNVAPVVLPGDANTPTAPANDIDDIQVTAQIRSVLNADASLSRRARDVTIATNPAAVVLRGSVTSAEKDRIESVAEQYAGTRQIVNQLLVRE